MGVTVFRCFSALAVAGALLAFGVAPASAQGPAEALVTVSCVTDTADVVSVEVPVSATASAIRDLPRENSCDVAAVDGVAHIAEANDTSRNLQYALDKVSFEDAWSQADGTGVTVAVIDTGVESAHPDLVGRVLTGRDYVGFPDYVGTPEVNWTATDPNGHGTHVAGIMGANANNSLGIAGAAPGITILPVRTMDTSGSGRFSNIAAGIEWAVDQGADVISLSLGSTTNNLLVSAAVTKALTANVVVVAAAGNDNVSTPFYPASLAGVISVAATTSTNTKASFSNYGPAISVSAPGDNIYSTYKGAAYAYMDGTSMATPYVSAEAALIREAQPTLTAAEVKALIESSATDLTTAPATVRRDDYTGAGLINPSQALCGGVCTTASAPVVTSLAPMTGSTAGGSSVTITGTDFTGATAVTFGAVSASNVTVVSSTSITAKTPAHAAGVVPVAVTTPHGTGSLTSAFTYTAPVTPPPSGGGGESTPAPAATGSTGTPDHAITEVRPAFGPLGGGTTILVIGYGFTGARDVTIGGKPATNFRYIDSNTVEVVTPPGELGWQRLIINLPIGDAKATFNYQEPVPVAQAPVTQVSLAGVAPQTLRVAARRGVVTVRWTDPSAATRASEALTVFRRGKAVRRTTVPDGQTSQVITGLTRGQTYRFRVTVTGRDGVPVHSPVSRVVTLP